MFCRDVITTAVACSCLLFMVASQSLNAYSCYEAIAETESCLADEIFELTVEKESRNNGRGDALGYYLYNITIDKVMKSAIALEDKMEVTLKITDHESCRFNITTHATYFIAVEEGKEFSSVQLCAKDGHRDKICKYTDRRLADTYGYW